MNTSGYNPQDDVCKAIKTKTLSHFWCVNECVPV